ncbi:hypothetical protein [Pengzhenrongella sp.]|uniref:hypothetical protein n=1 Tax=Pengzhenrongella sp. TaxID=2888820 RepID=UPI002F95B9E9
MLRRRLPALSTCRWITGTSVAAAFAWLLGMLPSSTHETWSHWPAPLVVGVGVLAGLALLVSIGVAQWVELRRHVPRAARWILANAVAWCVGLLFFVGVSTPLWHPGQALTLVAMIGALAGLAMAASMAVTTGLAMRHLSTSPLSANGS